MKAFDQSSNSSWHSEEGQSPPVAPEAQPIKIGKKVVSVTTTGAPVLTEIFTMSIGDETIELLPLKNWTQLDTHKWRTRGVLPRTPAGLEITPNQLKVAGQTVSPWDPDACAKIEQAFNEWLTLERQNRDLAKSKVQAADEPRPASMADEVVRFELDASGSAQPRLKCLEGQETVKTVALNLQGLTALIEQGLMRKPKQFKFGALHNWVELDGRTFRFKEDPNAAKALEETLNKQYVMAGDAITSPDVEVFANPASPSGFDIQFPATPVGVVENRRRHLGEETIQLLQDPEKCRVLRKGITARFAPPDVVFKVKMPDGGECPLESSGENIVVVSEEDGSTKKIDLSQPVCLLNLGVRELTAIFNHASVNRRARLALLSPE